MRRALRYGLRAGVGVMSFGATMWSAGSASAQTVTSTTSTSVPTLVPTNPDTGLNIHGSGAVVFIAVVIGALAVFLFAPVLTTILSNYRLQRHQQKFLDGLVRPAKGSDAQGQGAAAAATPDLVGKVIASYEKTTSASPAGDGTPANQSTTTSLLALATLLVVALALVIVLLASSSDASDLRKVIITALLSILASIAGFYFGARTAQVSAQQAQSAGGSSDGTPPTFIAASPERTVQAGSRYAYDFRASGTPAPRFGLVGAPPWMTIDVATGSVSGTALAEPTSFEYHVVASNAAGQASAGPFTVTVSAAP